MDYSDMVFLGQLIQRCVTQALAEKSAAKQDNGVTVDVSEICVGCAILLMSASFGICRKYETSMKSPVANEFECSHIG